MSWSVLAVWPFHTPGHSSVHVGSYFPHSPQNFQWSFTGLMWRYPETPHTLKVCAGDSAFYYTHFKITGDPCNLIGSKQCDLFGYLTGFFFALNHICCKLHHFCSKSHHLCSISHHFCFEYKVRSVKAFLFPLFNKPVTRSIKIWFWLNSLISKLF